MAGDLLVIGRDDHVVVVGAGLAGWRLCEYLRRDGFDGALTLIGEESEPPYERPPLSKQVLAGAWEVERTGLADETRVAELGVTYRRGVAATALDADAARVTLADGGEVAGSHVVVATGTRARRLPFSADARLHALRTRADSRALAGDLARLSPGETVVVVGGGFIGAEVATALAKRGLRPLVLEAGERPLHGPLGPVVSLWLADLAERDGVELRNSQHVHDVVERGDGFAVILDDEEVEAPVVVVGAGALPNVEWLEGSGLAVDNGVVVDEDLRAAERVYAVGDVARFAWRSPTGVESVRVEHWQVANDHAAALARHLTGGTPHPPMIPYFWSDQYGKKIQMIGHPHPSDDVTMVSGTPDEARFVALYHRDDVVSGVVALANPRGLTLSRPLLESATSVTRALALAPWAS
jgi:NADPH-dependent 2,4-dienoyl-CoA reductase/sulfur reductase-like enzyme